MLKKMLALIAVVLVAAAAWLAWQLESRPGTDRYSALTLPAAPDSPDELRVTFLGVSTLLFRDGTASILIDGFFTRPDLFSTAALRIEPDVERIHEGLRLANIDRLDAVIAAHSHYDHAMDTAEVAKRTGAVVVGSASTANIARGAGLSEARIHVVAGTEEMHYGDLTVTLVPSKHFPHGTAMGEVTEPLVPPARALDYLEGGTFSIFVEREGRTALVVSSAGYAEGALAGRHAQVVFLGIGLLGSKDDAYRDAYWRECVSAVGASRVVPIHWDDFSRGLDRPLVPLPRLLDDLDASMNFVLTRAAAERLDVRWPPFATPFDPFAGIEARALAAGAAPDALASTPRSAAAPRVSRSGLD